MITAGPSRSTVTLTVAVDSWPMRSLARTWMTLAPGASAAGAVVEEGGGGRARGEVREDPRAGGARPPVFLVALGPGGPEVRDGGLPGAGLGILQPALVEIPEGVAEDARRGHGRLLGLRRRQGLRRLQRGALADRFLVGDDRLVELVGVGERDALVAMGEVAVAHAG